MSDPTPPAVSDALREAVARDPRVDMHVWRAAATLSPEQIQQPEWLWFANDGTEGIPVARYSFGRWPKIGGAAPYVRADIPLSGPIASEIDRLTGENASLKQQVEVHDLEKWVADLDTRADGLLKQIARLTGERDAASEDSAKFFAASVRAGERIEAAEAETARLRAALERAETPLPISEYHEDMGFCLWWILPVREPPYSGSPLCDDWPEYHTHFTPLPDIRDAAWREAYYANLEPTDA